MAEQLLHGSRVELLDALEFLRVDAAGDEQAVDAKTVSAGKIGAHGIADRQHMAQLGRMAAAFGGERHRALIDRTVRLAVEYDLAAELAIEFGDRAGAIDQTVAALDDDVRIGADQRHLARERL